MKRVDDDVAGNIDQAVPAAAASAGDSSRRTEGGRRSNPSPGITSWEWATKVPPAERNAASGALV